MEQITWEYVNPVGNSGVSSQGATPAGNLVFRCNFYEPTYSGLQGQVLTPLGEIELNPTEPSICDELLREPFSGSVTVNTSHLQNGTYVYHLINEGTIRKGKLVKSL